MNNKFREERPLFWYGSNNKTFSRTLGYKQQKMNDLFRVYENRLEQCFDGKIVQCCQQYCSALLYPIAGSAILLTTSNNMGSTAWLILVSSTLNRLIIFFHVVTRRSPAPQQTTLCNPKLATSYH